MVKISPSIVSEISYEGAKSYPEECCGALFGSIYEGIRLVKEAKPLANVQAIDREQKFLISPQQYRIAEKAARQKNLTLLGFYHSHPDHPPEPSQYDLENALPGFVYLIVAIHGGGAGRLNAWVLRENRLRFDEHPIDVSI